MYSTLLIYIVSSLLVFRLLQAIYSALTSPLRAIPGPFLARFTKLWYLWRVYNGRFEQDNIDLHRKYGPIVRYGPHEYSIDDPLAAKTIYGHGTHFTKSSWYAGWGVPGKPTLFTDRDPYRHAQERRKYQTTFSMSALVTYEAYVDNCARIFCQRLDEMAQVGLAFNMAHWFQCYAFDVIGEITFSKRFGFLDTGLDVGGVMGALHGNMVYSTLVGVYSSLNPYLFAVMSKLRLGGAAGKAYLSAFIDQTIAKRKAGESDVSTTKAQKVDNDGFIHQTPNGTGPQDFLSKWLALHAEDPSRFTAYNVVVGMMANIIAGSDTTSTTLSAILYYLLKNPQTLTKLREEINQFQQKNQISNPITFKESQAMPYLQAVIKEAQRLHPAVGLPLARVVPEGGPTICGAFFPRGTVVGINPWVAHHNASVFGSGSSSSGFDVNEFHPERWLVDDKENLSAMERYYMPFGMGSRTCIGKHVSILEMSKLIPELVRRFDFKLDERLMGPGTRWTTSNYWFVVPVDFRVQVKRKPRAVLVGLE